MNEVIYFFSSWEPVGRILVVGTAMYASLVLLLRISGNRTLATLNTFDFIVTVAVGSAFGRALTAKNVALVEAVVAFALLIVLEFVLAWLQSRWPSFTSVMRNSPTLLFFRGEFQQESMRRKMVTEKELREAARKKSFASLDEIEAIVLESNGDFSVIGAGQGKLKQSDLLEVM